MQSRSLILAGVLALLAVSAQAQQRFSATLQGGAAIPVENFNDVDLKTGAGFEATVSYQVHPRIAVYAGWDWHRFVVQWPARPFLGNARKMVESGFALGAEYSYPLRPEGPVSVLLRAGGTLNQFNTKDDSGNSTEKSGYGLGWEMGAGLGVRVARNLQVGPALRLRMISRDLTIDATKRENRLTYLTLGAAVRYRF